ncbi:hypothetical protein G7047_11855 [Diaphorobacter sp. HDW4A]|uniref:hypothetical protein n=1 Tax=Diaphorobacter sp. HDW4A TaxID=2714924 RepID=UPI00140BFE73|nr:hypothetical protein [Diaphorobacter sp. HDW4A]QIL80519.1 hypothetical protein G7047_11855 [Diaphorobacter sp. HDW4A]
MSYEYTILNKDSKIDNLFDFISGELHGVVEIDVHQAENFLDFKDVELGGTWSYDVRLIRSASDVRVILVGWSAKLCNAFLFLLAGVEYEVFDDDSENLISIEEMFRCK